jgi:hypothetical protein
MAAVVVPFGPGTVTVGPTGTETDFSCEVIGGKVTHEYEEIGEQSTRLCGDVVPASQQRQDGFAFECENDLSATGLYSYCYTNDLTSAEVTYTPHTATAASWAGAVTVQLPGDIGADAFGEPISSTFEWMAIGPLTFTPAAAPPPLAAATRAGE